jgi:hypothetical protein
VEFRTENWNSEGVVQDVVGDGVAAARVMVLMGAVDVRVTTWVSWVDVRVLKRRSVESVVNREDIIDVRRSSGSN